MRSKREFRDEYRAARLRMNSRDVEKYSLDICRRVYKEVDWSKIRKICSYEPIAELKEVNILPLLETVKYRYPDTVIKIIGMSPKAKIPKAKFDLILVPTLVFDEQNYRLGWGGGWYDRFLAQQPQALKIGVAFKNSFVHKGLIHEPYDIRLDKIVTENR